MITYTPLWETMKKKGISTYTLREKMNISSSTVQRFKANKHVSTHTLDIFCNLLDCDIQDIVLHIKDEPEKTKIKKEYS